MAGLKQMMLTVCLGALVAGVFRMLSPGGGISKALRLTLGIFVLALLLAPLTGTDWGNLLSVEWQKFSAQTDWQQETMESTAKEEITSLVDAISSQLDVLAQIISVKASYRDGQVFVDQITLSVDGTEEQGKLVSAAIRGYLDTEVLVVTSEGGD